MPLIQARCKSSERTEPKSRTKRRTLLPDLSPQHRSRRNGHDPENAGSNGMLANVFHVFPNIFSFLLYGFYETDLFLFLQILSFCIADDLLGFQKILNDIMENRHRIITIERPGQRSSLIFFEHKMIFHRTQKLLIGAADGSRHVTAEKFIG